MTTKTSLHPKNKHRNGYDFKDLIKVYPSLSEFIILNKFNQQQTIDFSNAKAVKALNFALLIKYYQIQHWDFPKKSLCPPIPGRVDYIHYLADLLNESDTNIDGKISVLDIGTGASCIYPILGAREYNWNFVASDIDPNSVESANKNIKANKNITNYITCRLQKNSKNIFNGIIKPNDFFHLTMCNPPFHKSQADADSGTKRKWKNLNKGDLSVIKNLNFKGQNAELFCDGGEVAFIRQMIKESNGFQNQIGWFTCLVSKKDHISKIKLYLKKAHVSQIKIVKMAQGQKISRFVAWRFSN